MFGHIMEFDVPQDGAEDLHIRLAPLKREDMPAFVADGGMQSQIVGRYLGRNFAPVEEDEYAWFDKQREAADQIGWGVFVRVDDSWLVLGTTGLSGIATNTMFRRATSGYLVFRPDYWAKGIASHCHRARTLYAFEELGLSCIYSGVFEPNHGSAKALEKIGYVRTGINRNEGMHAGRFLHHVHYELINPAPWAWDAWWGDESPSQQWQEARQRTLTALEWARLNVHFV